MRYPDNLYGHQADLSERVARWQRAHQGVWHGHCVWPRDPAPGQPISVVLRTGGPQGWRAARCAWTSEPTHGEPASGQVALAPMGTTWDGVSWAFVTEWRATLPAQSGETMLRYRLEAQRDDGSWHPAERAEFAVFVAHDPAPEWARGAVTYHIFIDRFYPGDGASWKAPLSLAGFYGGTLRGVLDRLDYIQDLGCTAIWLSPLFPSPSHHGYDGTDYYGVEPRLGTQADLDAIFAGAHARGMRVILDFVCNHWSHEHETFRAAQQDPASPYRDWYTWLDWPSEYETYFGVRELPQLNLTPRGPGTARAYLMDCAQHWLRRGADGFRLDYAYGPPHDFWADFRQACRAAKPDCWLFGEVIHQPDHLATYVGRFDGVLDFGLCLALRETFAHGSRDVATLEAELRQAEHFYPPSLMRPLFLDNHDMNRFLFAAGEDVAALKLAALALFSLAHPPILYNGTEVGVTQERPIHQNDFGIFEEARQPMKWGGEQNTELLAYVRTLIHLRRATPDVWSAPRRLLHVDGVRGLWAYAVGQTVIAFNLGHTPQAIPIAVDDRLTDALGNATVTGAGVRLPARSGAWLRG